MDKYPDNSEAIELVHSGERGNNFNFYKKMFMNICFYLPLARCSIDKMVGTALMVGIMLAHLVDRRQQIDPLGYYLSVQEVKLHSKLHRLLGKHSEKRRILT